MNHDNDGNGKWSPVSKYVFIGFALIAGYFLITEHRAHVVQFLPFLLLAACPLMHLFHGHGGHGGHDDEPQKESKPDSVSGKQSGGPSPHQHH